MNLIEHFEVFQALHGSYTNEKEPRPNCQCTERIRLKRVPVFSISQSPLQFPTAGISNLMLYLEPFIFVADQIAIH